MAGGTGSQLVLITASIILMKMSNRFAIVTTHRRGLEEIYVQNPILMKETFHAIKLTMKVTRKMTLHNYDYLIHF